MKHCLLLHAILTCCVAFDAASAGTDPSTAHLMRGISLKKATVESNSPAILHIGAIELPATDVHLNADVTIQTSCNYFSGTYTNKTVRFSVRIAEDPERKAYRELARQMFEDWKDGEFLPQNREVFESGTNYVLLLRNPLNIARTEFLLWFDGRIIQGFDPLATYFYGEVADFTIGGVPVINGQNFLPSSKILRLFKRGTFGASNQRPGVDAGWRVLFAFQRSRPRATQAGRSPT